MFITIFYDIIIDKLMQLVSTLKRIKGGHNYPMDYLHIKNHDTTRFLSIGQAVEDPQWKHMRRTMACFEIILGIQGVSYIQDEQNQFTVGPGDALFLAPNRIHQGYKTSESEVEFFWICFECEDFEIIPEDQAYQKYNEMRLTCGGPFETYPTYHDLVIMRGAQSEQMLIPMFNHYEHSSRISILFQQLLHIFSFGYYTKAIGDYLMLSLLVELTQQNVNTYVSSISGMENNKEFSKLLEWIQLYSMANITLSDTAKQFHYNKNYLSKLFKRKTGMSIGVYINTLKMSQAKQLLCETSYPINQIAGMLGYTDDKYFMRLFKQYEHMSPTQFRNAYYLAKCNK